MYAWFVFSFYSLHVCLHPFLWIVLLKIIDKVIILRSNISYIKRIPKSPNQLRRFGTKTGQCVCPLVHI